MEQIESKIDLQDSSKRQKNNIDLVDKISDLPDSILGVIMSFLPTKEVVASSVLSKRWEFVWVTVNNLDFCRIGCDFEQDEDENMKFVRYVNRVFLLHDAGKLNRFSLVWHPWCISSHVSSWINTAITKDVRELSLCLETSFSEFDMPISVFRCVSLQSLELTETSTYISDALVIFLPRLEILKLDSVCFQSEEALEKLISGCPMLHSLHLNISFVTLDYLTCKVSSTTLRRLEIYFGYKSCLKLKAPSLEYLKLLGELSVEESLRSLVHVDFHIMLNKNYLSKKSAVDAVRAFDCAKALTLSANVMRALSYAGISLSTQFDRLVTLEVEINEFCSSFRDFLQSSDNLEVLIIHQHSNWDDHSDWIDPVEVPICLSFSLKKVQLDHYRGSIGGLKMICYMLKYGSALEVMQISYDGWRVDNKSKLLQNICKFPRKSLACEVQFPTWPSREFKPM